MRSQRKTEIQANCLTCPWRQDHSFCNVSGPALRYLQRSAKMVRCDQGTVLYTEGERADGIYILCNGRAKISIASRRGSLMILKIARPGEALGLAAAVLNHPHHETAQLLDTCQVKFIPKQPLKAELFKHAGLAFHATLQMSVDYSSARGQIRRLGFSMSGTQRLARLLLEWANHAGNSHEGESAFTIPYTHEEIAHMIGTTRETVTRALAKFKATEIIEIQGRTFVLNDSARLAEFAER